jgi:catechol 2,3-dioxygenase-like lactoylglutathione lyase family enzyme
MPRFHHANLGVPPGAEDAEDAFLVDVLGYRKAVVPPQFEGVARWYDAGDGTQIHLSIDPEHRAAARAHTALEVDAGIEARLDAAGVAYKASDRDGVRIVFCADPAGNAWELRR